MRRLSEAIGCFDTLTAHPAVTARDEVTLLTASEFGRTLTSNGDGIDRGWGAHHLVAGATVRGGDVHDTFPRVGIDTEDDVAQGRLLPRISVDQYAATLARSFGVADGQLGTIFPNLADFGAARDLGFMRS